VHSMHASLSMVVLPRWHTIMRQSERQGAAAETSRRQGQEGSAQPMHARRACLLSRQQAGLRQSIHKSMLRGLKGRPNQQLREPMCQAKS
jgi:hypothetical protein